jgi:hypothetical protein
MFTSCSQSTTNRQHTTAPINISAGPANTYLGPDDSFSEVSLFRCLRMAITSLQFLLNFPRVFYRHEKHM